jgi:hypothetical protein
MTAIGFALLAAMVGILGFAGMRLTPAYLENMKVKRILSDVKDELDGQGPTPQSIRRSIDNRINIEMVTGLKARDFEIEKVASGFRVTAHYERTEPFIANVFLRVEFNDEVEIGL